MGCSAMLSVMNAIFNKSNTGQKNISALYNMIVTSSAFVSWGVIYMFDRTFSLGVLLYSLAYGVFYTMALMGLFKALECGSVSLTAFIKQLSLIGVAVWGFIFWNTALTLYITVGIMMIVAALYLCFKPEKGTQTPSVPLKWVVFASMLLVGNAGCSIVQKYQQMAFDGRCGSMLMFFATGLSALVCCAVYWKSDKTEVRKVSKGTLLCPVLGGMSSAGLNLLVIRLLASPLSESIIFPGIAVGGLILTTFFSVLAYREKLLPHQWLGLAIGAVALIFLNI